MLSIFLFSELRKTQAILKTDDLFGDQTQGTDKAESDLEKELKKAQAKLDKIFLYAAEVHVLDSVSKEPIPDYSVKSIPASLPSEIEPLSKRHKLLWRTDTMNVLSPLESEPFRATIEAPGYETIEIDLSTHTSSSGVVEILMKKGLKKKVRNPDPKPNTKLSEEPQLIYDYLSGKYDGLIETEKGYELSGIGYSIKETHPTNITCTLLEKLLPDTVFFQTHLLNSDYGYPKVNVIVSIKRDQNECVLHEVLSPTFTTVSQEFLQQFVGIKQDAKVAQEALCLSIADLLKRITHEGDLRKGRFIDNVYHVQLWHGHLHWRDMQFKFSNDGYLVSVKVTGPNKQEIPNQGMDPTRENAQSIVPND